MWLKWRIFVGIWCTTYADSDGYAYDNNWDDWKTKEVLANESKYTWCITIFQYFSLKLSENRQM